MKRSAIDMIHRCASLQNVDAPLVPIASRGSEVHESGVAIRPSDTGIAGHADERRPHEDTRDDGSPIVMESPTA